MWNLPPHWCPVAGVDEADGHKQTRSDILHETGHRWPPVAGLMQLSDDILQHDLLIIFSDDEGLPPPRSAVRKRPCPVPEGMMLRVHGFKFLRSHFWIEGADRRLAPVQGNLLDFIIGRTQAVGDAALNLGLDVFP